MLLTEAGFGSYARHGVADAAAGTGVILVLGVETREQVDELAGRAEAAGGSPVGVPRNDGYRYQRGFTDLDGHHWEALCLVGPAVAEMRGQPFWPAMAAAAQTLAYEALVLGPGNALPVGLLARITQPTLVLNGGDSPAWMGTAGKAVTEAIPGAVHRVLEDQAHNVAPEAIVPELLEFFLTT
jgi:pimeloyl-ACP methyl ester carboxylesterase